jgi:hypothetical protein
MFVCANEAQPARLAGRTGDLPGAIRPNVPSPIMEGRAIAMSVTSQPILEGSITSRLDCRRMGSRHQRSPLRTEHELSSTPVMPADDTYVTERAQTRKRHYGYFGRNDTRLFPRPRGHPQTNLSEERESSCPYSAMRPPTTRQLDQE